MSSMPSAIPSLPAAPKGTCPEVRGAWKYLEATHASVDGLLLSYRRLRKGHERGAIGRPRTEETDILRSAIVFTSSGVDACCKMLLRESLPTLLTRDSAARRKYESFLREEIGQPRNKADLHEALIHTSPRERLIDYYVDAQTRGSLQSSGDLRKRVKQTLGIPDTVVDDEALISLDPFFKARNQVVHDMDFKSLREAVSAPTRGAGRHPRAEKTVADQCGAALTTVADLIHATAIVLRTRTPA